MVKVAFVTAPLAAHVAERIVPRRAVGAGIGLPVGADVAERRDSARAGRYGAESDPGPPPFLKPVYLGLTVGTDP